MSAVNGAVASSWTGKAEEPINEEMEEESEVEPENEPAVGVLLCTFPGCLKEFSTRWSLNRHTRVHTGVKPYRCNFCFKEFAQNCSLKRHEQTHSQERVWVCDYQGCGKRFKLKEYLEVHHQRTHFKDEPSDPVVINLTEVTPAAMPGAPDPNEIIEKLRERLVRMGLRHHDQLTYHQKREEELLDALREVANTLDETLGMLDELTAANPNYVPQRIRNVAQRYTTKHAPAEVRAPTITTTASSSSSGAVPSLAALKPLPLPMPLLPPPIQNGKHQAAPPPQQQLPMPFAFSAGTFPPGMYGVHPSLPAPLSYQYPLNSLPAHSYPPHF